MVFSAGQWVMVPGGSSTPEPPTVEIIEHDDTYIKLHIQIPGFWVEDVYEEGQWFKRIYLSDTARTNFIGRPELPVIRDLIARPDESDIEVDVYDTHIETFSDYHIYPLQREYPMDYEGPIEFDYDEDFYNTPGDWYPESNAIYETPGHFKDFDTFWSVARPFRWRKNLGDEKLEVNYDYKVTYVYDAPMGEGDYPSVSVLAENDLMYANTLMNYDYLDINSTQLIPGANYLIVTTSRYYEPPNIMGPYNKLKTLLEDRGFTIAELVYQSVILNWEDVYDDIRNIYETPGNNLRYLLIIGDEYAVPQGEMWKDYGSTGYKKSDYPYQCMDDSDFDPDPENGIFGSWLPEMHAGRLPVSNNADLTAIVEKLDDYERENIPDGDWNNKHLFVTHWEHSGDPPDGHQFCDLKRALYTPELWSEEYEEGKFHQFGPWRDYYYEFPDVTKIYAWDEGAPYSDYPYPDNRHVIHEIDQGYAVVNYYGHGGARGWVHWVEPEGQCFYTKDIDSLNNDIYPVVFNMGCSMGWLTCYYDSICEVWLNTPDKGAVGAVGSTVTQYSSTWGGSSLFEVQLYRGMYGAAAESIIPPIDHKVVFGPLMNTSKIRYYNYLSYVKGEDYAWMHWETRFYDVFGEPSMEFRLDFNEADKLKMSSTMKNIEPTSFVLKGIYPNPSGGDEMNVEITTGNDTEVRLEVYDITGRMVEVDSKMINSGSNVLSINTSELSSGVYILKASTVSTDDNTMDKTETKKFVVVK